MEETDNEKVPSATDTPAGEGFDLNPEPPDGREPGDTWKPIALIVVGLALLVAIVWWGMKSSRKTAGSNETASAVAGSAAPAADPVIATVNGIPIHKAEFDAAVESVREDMRPVLQTPTGKKRMVDELVRMKLLAKKAEELGVNKSPEVVGRIALSTENVLANAAIEKMLATQGTSDLKALYEENKEQFEAIKARQIMVAYKGGSEKPRSGPALSEDEAMAKATQIVKQIRGGADFGQVARQVSDDRSVQQTGGSLGEVGRGMLPPAVEKVVFSLKPGEVSDPVKTQFGIHIFQVTGREVKSFEQAAPILQQQGQGLRVKKIVDGLMKTAKIDYSPDFIPPAEVKAAEEQKAAGEAPKGSPAP